MLHDSKSKHSMGVLYLYITEGNRLSSEKVQCHFYLILPIMPDKVALMSTVLLCIQLLPGNYYVIAVLPAGR